MKGSLLRFLLLIVYLAVQVIFFGCGKYFSGKSEKILQIEEVDQEDPGPGDDGTYQEIPASGDGTHPIFSGLPGVPIASYSMGAVDPDPTGLNACTDYDGDGISNSNEIMTNPFVADYPSIVTRISEPITLEIRVSETSISENHTEIIEDTDVKDTISNSMEDKQYSQLNLKTTPYVTKDSYSRNLSSKRAYSYSHSDSISKKGGGGVSIFGCGVNASGGKTKTKSDSDSKSIERGFSRSAMSEKTVFDDVNFTDNLDRNGIEYTNDTIETMAKNYRQSETLKDTQKIGPNDGYVRTSLFIKNMTVNMPVRISNVICTLSFRTQAGEFLPVKTFRLRNEDYSEFNEEIYGATELGPYTIEVANLNTYEVKKALANGYVPQIHVVSYDMHLVEDSNYYPGVDNLKIVEETAKGRTATIKIIGKNARDIYRVASFDVVGTGSIITPGISLKKALFNIFRKRIGNGESWESDSNDNELTVPDSGLKWKADAEDPDNYSYSDNRQGNTWEFFETYIKSYTTIGVDENNQLIEETHLIETIKRIGNLDKYNPFNINDNSNYNPNERLSDEEIYKMKYWVILHNGKYFGGDLNDPVWVGDRYEIIFFDVEDFSNHFTNYCYVPLQAMEEFYLNTRWNSVSNEGEFARSINLGKVVQGEVIELEVTLDESRYLFNSSSEGREFGDFVQTDELDGLIWHNFQYDFYRGGELSEGIPGEFNYDAWGGTNFIALRISESENARYYAVSFWEESDIEDNARIVKITPEELDLNNAIVRINRGSINYLNQQETIGFIDGGYNYNVKVKAHSVAYNVPVSTSGINYSSVNNQYISTVTVHDTGSPAQSYYITASSETNTVNVMIDESLYAEYHIIKIYGPINYGNGNNPDTSILYKEQIGHPGNNSIEIGNPVVIEEYLTDEEKNFEVPGVFRVEVKAVNSTSYSNDVLDLNLAISPENDKQMVLVPFERYANQKGLAPNIYSKLLDPGVVDIEVNFNDGSGWFKLKLSHGDASADDRTLDCRYTSYIEHDKQIVHIYFTPPTGAAGSQNEFYNVFVGGREDVEVSIRTVPKPEYRDTLWIKSNCGRLNDSSCSSTFSPDNSRYLFVNNLINQLLNYDIVTYWLDRDLTDASHIEDVESGRIYESLSTLAGVANGEFGVVSSDKNDLFFSPLEEHTYLVRASIVEEDISVMMAQGTHVDNPDYRAIGGNQSIALSNFDSQYADYFTVYWMKSVFDNVNDVFEDYTWTSLADVNENDGHFTGHSLIISKDKDEFDELQDLEPNTTYTVCVIAHNSTSESSKIYKVVKTIPDAECIELVELNSSNYTYGHGWFHNSGKNLTNNLGNILLNNVHFFYDEALLGGTYDIYDTGIDGSFNEGKFFRIVENGQNVAGPTGLNLTPVAKDLSNSINPPDNEVWIDPERGEFIFPRPAYWSRCESITNTYEYPEIADFTPSWRGMNRLTIGSSYIKWNNGLRFYRNATGTTEYNTLYPLGETGSGAFPGSGTISFWYWMNTSSYHNHWLDIYVGNNTRVKFRRTALAWAQNLIIGGVGKATAATTFTAVRHVYILWDKDGGLDNGKSFRVFVNGNEILSSTTTFNTGADPVQFAYGTYGYAEQRTDNIKVWTHAIEGHTPSTPYAWLYNGSAGIEDALHVIYGPDNGYKPLLTEEGSGVGYYYTP